MNSEHTTKETKIVKQTNKHKKRNHESLKQKRNKSKKDKQMNPRQIETRNKTETKTRIFALKLKTITCLLKPYLTPCKAGL